MKRWKAEKVLFFVWANGICLVFFLTLGLVFYSIFIFGVGYHNLDLSQNMMRLEVVYNTTFFDQTLFSGEISMSEGYLVGARQMIGGFWCFGLGSICLIISFFQLMEVVQSWNKYFGEDGL